MSIFVFAGPTIFNRDSFGLNIYPPARLGSVYWAWAQGAKKIAIIDGYYGVVPSIWHKEILFVLSKGVEVWGAASLGALRAAELYQYGMGGYGKIWRLYRRGILSDDDEVCLTHAPEQCRYQPLTVPMVNVRFALRKLRRIGELSLEEENKIVKASKAIHFAERSERRLSETFEIVLGPTKGRYAWENYSSLSMDTKGDDAEGLMQGLKYSTLKPPSVRYWRFPETLHWRKQFVERLKDLPPGDIDVHS